MVSVLLSRCWISSYRSERKQKEQSERFDLTGFDWWFTMSFLIFSFCYHELFHEKIAFDEIKSRVSLLNILQEYSNITFVLRGSGSIKMRTHANRGEGVLSMRTFTHRFFYKIWFLVLKLLVIITSFFS